MQTSVVKETADDDQLVQLDAWHKRHGISNGRRGWKINSDASARLLEHFFSATFSWRQSSVSWINTPAKPQVSKSMYSRPYNAMLEVHCTIMYVQVYRGAQQHPSPALCSTQRKHHPECPRCACLFKSVVFEEKIHMPPLLGTLVRTFRKDTGLPRQKFGLVKDREAYCEK